MQPHHGVGAITRNTRRDRRIAKVRVRRRRTFFGKVTSKVCSDILVDERIAKEIGFTQTDSTARGEAWVGQEETSRTKSLSFKVNRERSWQRSPRI